MEFLFSNSDMPVGFRFFPTDSELIFHLWNMIHIRDYRHPLITTYDIYKHEPWLLPWDSAKNRFFHGNERYFFVRREPLSGKDRGTRPKRTIDSGGGWWHANTEDKVVPDEGSGVVGYVKSLTFYIQDENKRKERKGNRKQEGIKKDWIMHEYVFDKKNVREWVLCRIHCNGKEPLSIPVVSSSTLIDQLPQPQLEFCGGPDPQLLMPLKKQKIGVVRERVQEPFALTSHDTGNLQETGKIDSTEDVCKGVEDQSVMVTGAVEGDGPIVQQPLEQHLEECDVPFAEELDGLLEIGSETEFQLQTLHQDLDEFEKSFVEGLNTMLEWNFEQESQQQTLQQQPLEGYDAHTISEPEAQPQELQVEGADWQGRIEDFWWNPGQASQQEPLLEECDNHNTKPEPVAQLKQPELQAEEAERQGREDDFWWNF